MSDPSEDNNLDPNLDPNSETADAKRAGDSGDASQAAGEAAQANREPTVEIPAHEAELTKLREEKGQLEAKLQRAMADTQNILRRQRQELQDGRRRVLEGLTSELLPVLDTFGLALAAYDGDAGSGNAAAGNHAAGSHAAGDSAAGDSAAKTGDTGALVEGVRMVQTLLNGTLERHGLQAIPDLGKPFDPSRHEALGVEPSPGVAENEIVRVVQTGYVLGDHVVRHSKVIVAGPHGGGEDASDKS
ncbi:MAG: nucleotide exchange factor GrpE [Planctomycetota bacterium]